MKFLLLLIGINARYAKGAFLPLIVSQKKLKRLDMASARNVRKNELNLSVLFCHSNSKLFVLSL